MSLLELYHKLYDHYGAQGWWPLSSRGGYHPSIYYHTLSQEEIFEVALGSILTQNTSFRSVEKSLQNLSEIGATTSQAIQQLSLKDLKEAIRPSGYYNQKAEYILYFIAFFEDLAGCIPSRKELLGCKGIGEETADSILLFGYAQSEFKVDAYTKRILSHLGYIDAKAKYAEVKELLENSLEQEFPETLKRVEIYQEFHALFVAHAKVYYSKKPYGVGCFLKVR
jgi:endonuclease III related protein